ncbi:hypothetical protein D3C79_1048330 [compost metagenome]
MISAGEVHQPLRHSTKRSQISEVFNPSKQPLILSWTSVYPLDVVNGHHKPVFIPVYFPKQAGISLQKAGNGAPHGRAVAGGGF